MENYNYADEIIKDNYNLKFKKIEEEDILANILNEQFSKNHAVISQQKIQGFMEGLKTDNIIVKS